jgi:hypothetical protein
MSMPSLDELSPRGTWTHLERQQPRAECRRGDGKIDVDQLSKARLWFNETAANPPIWMRLLYVPMFALVALMTGERRGWVVGIVAAVVYGGMGLAVAITPGGTVRWSRAHPKADNAVLGPLLFLALAYLTRVSVWWCLAAGVLGSLGGIALGAQRRRSFAERDDPV